MPGRSEVDTGAVNRTGRDGAGADLPIGLIAALAGASALAVLIANLGGIAVGDDGVGYTAIADSLLAGGGLRYFLEDPLTVWPPLWPALMALLSLVTPLDPTGAAVVLNAAVSAGAVVVAWRALRRFVPDERLVLLGTVVVALGSSTIGFGHLLMTDLAFAVVVIAWILALANQWEAPSPGRWRWLAAAVGLVWLGFSLRYVGVVLNPTGALWLLIDRRRRWGLRLGSAAVFAAGAATLPALWVLRNLAADGTALGPRYASARGPVQNAADIVATLGRFLLPGVANGRERVWAAVAVVVLLAAAAVTWRVLGATADERGCSRRDLYLSTAAAPFGLLVLTPVLYLIYLLYIRSTTALNQLDLRLLEPAYLPLVVGALGVAARSRRIPPVGASIWWRTSRAAAHVWAVANVVAGLVAVVLFANGDPYFEGNYSSEGFDRVRAAAVLDTLPAGCSGPEHVSSNLPNALYPELEAEWSPRRTGLESDEPVDDLDVLVDDLARGTRHCLVWVDTAPRYGHLWTREQLDERVDLVELGAEGSVTVYAVELPDGGRS